MAAYAALLSLDRSLHEILELERYIDPLTKGKIASLHEKIDSVITFLEDYSDKHRGKLDLEGKEIIEATYEVQDFMDSYLYSVLGTKYDSSSSEANCDEVSLVHGLNMAFERIHFVWEETMKLKNSVPATDLRSKSYSSPGDDSSSVKITAKNMVVGFDDDLNAIKERLYDDSLNLQVIPIVGMGGIGKTTLARKAYDDSLLDQYFDICAWITVSQEYQRRKILSELLQDFNGQGFQQRDQESEAQLAKLVYQNLIGRRYLIVIDDIWSNDAWDDLKMILPDDGNGSRTLITTRLSDVAIHTGSNYASLHQMKLLNEDQSWELLRERVFGQESCPLQLMEIGKKTARTCGGLPLTIVVVAGLLLSSGNITKEELWEDISENISLTESTIALHCSKVLYLSYDWLPLRLKPCFLYITTFPEDSNIHISKLIRLWMAEGFLKPDYQFKCLEDVGERYLEDFVNRNLISVGKKGLDGRPEIVGVHDLLREICITKAEEEGFFHYVSKMKAQKIHTKKKMKAQKYTKENPNRRLSIHYEHNFQEWQILDPTVRSALFFSETNLESELPQGCRHINLLDASIITWLNFSVVISTLVNLRYIDISLTYKSCPHGFPTSISKLFNLQCIIAISNFRRLQVPFEILEMPKLRHLIIEPSFVISYPSNIGVIHESNLQTLEIVTNLKFTEAVINLLVNIKKIRVILEYSSWDDLRLDNLFHLQNLEELRVHILDYNRPSRTWNYAFPISLRRLSLDGVCLPWDNMTIIGSLPNLQVLEIVNNLTDEASEWMPIEGEFVQLKYFCSTLDYLVKWEAEKEHFPSLESLILIGATLIDEIPYGIGEIDTLQLIELRYCTESVVDSAKQIKEQQHENGNNAFQVCVYVFGSMGQIIRLDV